MGVPVVSSLHGGIPEAVWDGVTGLLAPERDHNKLAEHIISFSRMTRSGKIAVERQSNGLRIISTFSDKPRTSNKSMRKSLKQEDGHKMIKIAIYKTGMLPPTQTFIPDQVNAMRPLSLATSGSSASPTGISLNPSPSSS